VGRRGARGPRDRHRAELRDRRRRRRRPGRHHRADWDHRTAEIGYWVAPWARRNGSASRAAALLAPWAIKNLTFARIACDVDVDNVASQRVAERAGFTRDGVLRSMLEVKGRRWTLAAYSLTADDLAP
jgi:RimJ/RimL family protein N-acetyltransferase